MFIELKVNNTIDNYYPCLLYTSAFMWYEDHTFESKLFTFNILDRVGGGDAFASGLIYAIDVYKRQR